MNLPPLKPAPVDPDRAQRLLGRAEDAVRRLRRAGADRLAVAYAWALDHRANCFADGSGAHDHDLAA
jgi:hypothetical protein